MDLLMFVLLTVIPVLSDGLTVRGPSGPLVAPLGSSVVLPCSVDEPLSVDDLEVEWRRTDSETLVHLYQDGESQTGAQQQDYQDRAHFFTEEIQHGNFSLRLDDLRAEDQGQYTCSVHSQQESGETVVQIKDVVRLRVSGSGESISASVGEDVTLSCSVDSHISPEHIEIAWKKTDQNIQVLLYQNNKTLPDSAHDRYRDRVEFFTDETPKGNFSLRLKSVRTEDKGVYMCEVFAGGLSANTTVELERLGFSVPHILVLILCVSASGSALLLCCLIYCRHQNDSILHLHLFLVVCPNMIMFLAFVFWGVSEGSVSESVCCCALYLLRPLLLLWAAPYVNNNRFSVQIQSWVQKYSYAAEYAVFSLVVYSALFASAWEKFLNYAVFNKVMIMVMFSIVFVCCFCKIIYILLTEVGKKSGRIIEIFDLAADMMFQILPTLQFMLLFYTFGAGRGGFIMIMILPVLMMMTNDTWLYRCYYRLNFSESVVRTVMLIFILVTNALMIGLYIFTLEKQTDPIGWGCVMVFLQILWTVMFFTDVKDVLYRFLSLSQDFHRYVAVYVFGSVAVVLLNSAALITELILKSVTGDRVTEDLRFIVFPSECLFVISLLISGFSGSKIAGWLKSCQTKVRSLREKRPQQNQNTAEEEEMSRLNSGDPDSVRSQS